MTGETQNYREGLEYLAAQFEQVNGCDFYRELFPDNENADERHTDFSHPNAIYLYYDKDNENTKRSLSRRTMYSDTWEQDYMDFVERNPMTLCGGLVYRKRSNTLENAQRMNALIIDLDGVGLHELKVLFHLFKREPGEFRALPRPTFLVISGNGVHIYYVFEEPIDLYPNIKLQLKALKYDLTFRIWDYKSTSQLKKIQYQSINQGFRMVGSINNKYGTEIIAFRTGDRVTIDYLNQYAKPENRVDVRRPFRPSQISRAQAKEKYPEWFERRIVQGDKKPKKWDIAGQPGHNGDELYNWWLRQIHEIKGGHRYFFLMCMAIYACKCDIPKSRLRKDMEEAFEILKGIDHENKLTKDDIKSAMEAYSKDYYNFKIEDIEKLTDVRIERNKRNGRKRSDHIKLMNFVRDEIYQNKAWRNMGGRPSANQTVLQWRSEHPEGRKADCIRDTGLSKPTVYKWWEPKAEPLEAIVKKALLFESWEVQRYVFKSELRKLEWSQQVEAAKIIVESVNILAAALGITFEEAYDLYSENAKQKKRGMLPQAFVVEGQPDMFERMMEYSMQGIRSVEILTQEEYEEIFGN